MDNKRRKFLTAATGSILIAPSLLPTSALGYENINNSVLLSEFDDVQELLNNNIRVLILNPEVIYQWSNISLPSGTSIIGNGATIKTTSLNFPIIKIDEHSTNIIIKDIRFDGDVSTPINMPVQATHIGIEVYKASNITIEGCDFKNFLGTGISTFNYTGQKMSSAIQVRGCRFIACQYGFTAWYNCEYGILEGCHFTECRAAIFICSGNWLVTGNIVVKCRASYIATNLANEIAFSTGGNFSHGNVSNNTFNHSNDSPWAATPLQAGTTFENIAGIYFKNVLPVTFTGNALWYTDINISNIEDDFYFTGCTLSNNTIKVVGTSKVYLSGCWIRASVNYNNKDVIVH
ncbi:MAG: hypothetical protein GY919_06130 [Photobacterium aquimaris]|nr:hypothetical protein [Photobacterium aquimaris]